jgi:NADH:ubiquinone oxidoreductase subunit H
MAPLTELAQFLVHMNHEALMYGQYPDRIFGCTLRLVLFFSGHNCIAWSWRSFRGANGVWGCSLVFIVVKTSVHCFSFFARGGFSGDQN